MLSPDGAIEVTVMRHDAGDDDMTESYLLTTAVANQFNRTFSANVAMMAEYSAIVTISKYALPVIIALGTIGNILSFLVLIRCHMRSTSVYHYLMALAIADTCVLYVSAFKTWIRLLTGFELLYASEFSCRLLSFLFLYSLHLSSWLVVMVTVDRFTVVWFPFRASSWCTVRRARLATVALATLFAAYNCHVFWTYELNDDVTMNRVYCGPVKTLRFMSTPFDCLQLVTYSLVPFLVILALNAAIVTRLRWRPVLLPRARSGATGRACSTFSGASDRSSSESSSASGRQAKVTYMLVVVSFAWLVLTLPKSIHTIVFELDSHRHANVMMFRGLFFLLMYTNHAINFYLYCITGRKFRRQLEELSKAVCARRRRWRKRRRSAGSTACSPSRRTHLQKTNMVDFELHDLVVVT